MCAAKSAGGRALAAGLSRLWKRRDPVVAEAALPTPRTPDAEAPHEDAPEAGRLPAEPAHGETAPPEPVPVPEAAPPAAALAVLRARLEANPRAVAYALDDPAPEEIEGLFDLVWEFCLAGPMPATLHVRFGSAILRPGADAPVSATLAARLGSGSPFGAVAFSAADEKVAAHVAPSLGLVPAIAPAPGDLPPATAPLIRCAAFGPVALVFSALWGAVGSDRAFAAQVKHLVARGYFVARVFIDHFPTGIASARTLTLLNEHRASSRGHLHILAERDTGPEAARYLAENPEFAAASPVRRTVMILEQAQVTAWRAMEWAARHAALALVNHAMHLGFAERLTDAPIILETHDIFSDLLDLHRIPHFVPPGPDAPDLRMAEEIDLWRRADVCVNISPPDDAVIRPHAHESFVARPYAPALPAVLRGWAETAAANRLPPALAAQDRFDIMLWGSPHQGNVAAFTWLIEDVVAADPRLRTARVLIVGKVVEYLPASVKDRANVFACNHVDRLDEFVAASTVLVLPDRGGTGLSIKAMDTFAYGHAFAATRMALRGLDLDADGYHGAEGSAALADDIHALLADAAARARRAGMGRSIGARNFSADRYAETWDAVLRAATAPGRLPRRLRAAPIAVAELPTISAIICTFNRYPLLGKAIQSLLRQDFPAGRFEIIVVDNSADQDRARRHQAAYAGHGLVNYVLEPQIGLSAARNTGMAAAAGRIVAFMDDDAIAWPGWLGEIVRAFAEFPAAGTVGGRVLPRWLCPRPAWLDDKLSRLLTIIDWGGDTREKSADEWFAGANLAFRRDLLIEAGGFSPHLGRRGPGTVLLSNEDTLAAERLAARGAIAVYAPAATVEHVIDPARLAPDWLRKRAAWQAVSDFLGNSENALRGLPGAVAHLRHAAADPARLPLGFFAASDDPARINDDVALAYNLIVTLLAGGAAPDAALSAALARRA